MTASVVKDRGGTVTFYAPQIGAPSAATAALYEPGGGVIAAAASATRDTVSTTVSAASRGARSVTVGSATGITAGRRYQITSGGDVHTVVVRSVSGTTVYLTAPLTADVASTSPLVGVAMMIAVSAAQAAIVDRSYRIEWVYTISSVEYEAQQTYDVVAAAEYYETTIGDVISRYPRIEDLLRAEDPDGSNLLATAWSQIVGPQLRARGVRPETVRDVAALTALHTAACNLLCSEDLALRKPNAQEQLSVAKASFDTALARWGADVAWLDEDQNLSRSSTETDQTRTHVMVVR